MAKNEGLVIAIVAIAAILLLGQNANVPPAGGDVPNNNNAGGVDLCKLVDGQVSFTAQDKFLAGTARTGDWVRVIELNGDSQKRDLGQISLDSGTKAVTPEGNYKLYYGENTTSTARYTYIEDYSAPCKDATDYKVGFLCTVDTVPTVTVFDENGQVQSGVTNAQAMGANAITTLDVKVKVAADQCYGNPQAPSKNAICLGYNGTVFDSVKASTTSSAIPYSVSSDDQKPAGYSQSCYELDLLKDTGSQTLQVTMDASATQPTGQGHAVNITLEDAAFDLDQDSLNEIWGFQDESNNNLGAAIRRVAGIQVS